MLPIIPLLILGFIGLWAFKGWETLYFVGEMMVESRSYPSDRNPFKRGLRKIYRNKQLSDLPYDIYVLVEVNRLLKTMKYVLADIDDQPELTKKLMENLNEKRN